jgi:Sulfotransferase domain
MSRLKLSKSDRVLPNFFIVGAPRCGTTSIWSYLARHPDAYMSYQKEPLFFGSDLTKIPNEFFVLGKDRYLDLFQWGAGKKIRGEASVMYMLSKKAAEEIYAFNPEARILIMLRNPVDVVYSHHGQLRWGGYEDIADFAEAYDAEADRRQGRRMPSSALMREALYYSEVGLLGEQVERYLKVFPREQVKILFHEDLARAPHETYFSLLDFLGLDRISPKTFEAKNPHKEARSNALAVFLMRPPRAVTLFLDRLPLRSRHWLITHAQAFVNTRWSTRKPLSREMRSWLLAHFAPDVRKLSHLTGRDLSEWLSDGPPKSQRSSGLEAGVQTA